MKQDFEHSIKVKIGYLTYFTNFYSLQYVKLQWPNFSQGKTATKYEIDRLSTLMRLINSSYTISTLMFLLLQHNTNSAENPEVIFIQLISHSSISIVCSVPCQYLVYMSVENHTFKFNWSVNILTINKTQMMIFKISFCWYLFHCQLLLYYDLFLVYLNYFFCKSSGMKLLFQSNKV